MSNFKRKYTLRETKQKIGRFCASRERCHKEVRSQLLKWGWDVETTEELIALLIEQGFLDEMRFARAFVHDKIFLDRWGKRKVADRMRMREVPAGIINRVLNEVDEERYHMVAGKVLRTRMNQLQLSPPLQYKDRQRLLRFMVQRGFEPEGIYPLLRAE